MDELISTNDLTKRFHTGKVDTLALAGIDLTVADGEFVAIKGPSGSGKSTLLSLLGLLDEPSSGEYRLRGQSVTQLTQRQKRLLRNQHIGWVFQNFNLVSDMTALENVTLPLRYDHRRRHSQFAVTGHDVLTRVGLGGKERALPHELSGGEQQRVGIARALINEPDLILADEPTGNLDSHSGQAIIDLLTNLVGSGATILLVTHDDDVASQCQRVLHLSDGLIIDDQRKLPI